MSIVKFTTNWNNKLSCRAFTTLRLHNPTKYVVGREFSILLNGRKMGNATLVTKYILKISQLNNYICYLDMGYNLQQTIGIIKKMYPSINLETARFDLCLFTYQKVKPIYPKQTQLQFSLPYNN